MKVYHVNNPSSPDLICFPVPAQSRGCSFPGLSWGKTVHLEYMLKKHEKALAFQVVRQSSAVSSFLQSGNRFQASNGLIIATGAATHPGWPDRGGNYPEYMESANILYLQGGNRDDGKIDTTTIDNNGRRDRKFKIVESALKEFVQFIKNGQYNRYTGGTEEKFFPQTGVYTL